MDLKTTGANPASHSMNQEAGVTTLGGRRLQAGTLAVGTEVTDGQIIDRNSAWISQMVTDAGVQVIEHRSVADDRADIARGLRELADRCDLLFVTGGLGPTSDDFTRELIAEVFHKPLEYDEASWTKIRDMLLARGISAKEIQKQQCYFPQGSRILNNPAGTANAFSFSTTWPNAGSNSASSERNVQVYVLPGPPSEIAAIWDLNLKTEMSELTPVDEREELVIMRCLGNPESDVAEMTESAIAGSGLRVGYRAHLPYVEVKLWVPVAKREMSAAVLAKVESVLGDWIISRGKEDLADILLKIFRDTRLVSREPVAIIDSVTAGFFQERLVGRTRELKYKIENVPFTIQTCFGAPPEAPLLTAQAVTSTGSHVESSVIGVANLEVGAASIAGAQDAKGPAMLISALPGQHGWLLELRSLHLKGANGGKTDLRLELMAPKHYSLDSERARKFLTEFIFLNVKQHVEKV